LNVIQKLYNDSIISKSQLTKLMTVILTQVNSLFLFKIFFYNIVIYTVYISDSNFMCSLYI